MMEKRKSEIYEKLLYYLILNRLFIFDIGFDN